ncbi:BON domain-containing protein [Candidatus Bathyarchaeota archaeon]|nr:BON domain-containing protein [Candidatus Bathyarchaeota archaeon]
MPRETEILLDNKMSNMVKQTELKKQEIIDEMVWNSMVDASNIKVKINGGVVTLAGKVGSYREKKEADLSCWKVAGVHDVINDIKVDLSKNTLKPSDDEMEKRITNILLWDINLNSLKIKVSVDGGIVTIEGTVDVFWKLSYVIDRISGVTGILGIVNKLAVTPKKRVSDEIIAEDVMDAIDRSAVIFPGDIDVKVEDNVVTLYGTVANWGAWKRAFDAAANTYGVIEVIDNLKVTGASGG